MMRRRRSTARVGAPSLLRAVLALLVCALLAACGQPAQTLTVFAAASLTEAFTALGKNFEAAHLGTVVTLNFAGSQQLAQQIAQGAPADVFASANTKQMNAVIETGQVAADAPRTFARNRLVVVAPKDNPARIRTLKDLAKPGIKLILATPAVPVGGYALAFLAKASQLPDYTEAYSPTVLQNVVSYEQNVKAVLSKVVLGEADAGIVYTSDIALDADKITQVAIPDELNTLATYPIAPIRASQNPALAQRFISYVLSDAGQQILEKYGFIAVQGA